ncbi:MAG: response regulator [Chloroflexi bacterium]|nr:response regulator [Chloroflexota bacterium]
MERILVLEDEPGFQLLLTEILTQAGYKVTTASSGDAALEVIRREQLDLLMIDNRMPGMSGMDFLRLIRAADNWAPVIVMTAYADVPVVVESMRLGALDFLVKPFQIESVIPLVERCLGKQSPPPAPNRHNLNA